MVNNIYWLWESIIPKEMCEYIRDSADWSNKFDAGVGQMEGPAPVEMRKTDITLLDVTHPGTCILNTFCRYANEAAGWNFDLKAMEPVQIGRYVDGGHYDWHVDASGPMNELQRKVSIVLILDEPDSYEGGFLEIHSGDMLAPKLPQGSIITFPSFINHRVTPVTSGVRHTAVGWYSGAPFK